MMALLFTYRTLFSVQKDALANVRLQVTVSSLWMFSSSIAERTFRI